MAKLERIRDFPVAVPPGQYFEQKLAEGWRLLAIEWERGASSAEDSGEEIPFGLRVASDCRRLEDHPEEIEVLMLMKEVIVRDGPLSQAAQAINERGYRTRDGQKWSPVSLFNLLPRLIDLGPRLNKSQEWAERRRRLVRAG